MKKRGFGRIYRPKWKDRKTGKYRESPTWWIEYWYRGKQIRESAKSSTKSDAVNLLQSRNAEKTRGRFIGPAADKVMFDDLSALLMTDYKVNKRESLERGEDALAHLRLFFGDYRALEITPSRVDEYIVKRLEEMAAEATIHYELAILKRMFSLAYKKEYLLFRPYVPSIQVHNVRKGFFEEDEFRAVQKHLPVDIRPVTEFAYLTGWRKREVLHLQWREIDFKAKEVRLEPETTKNKEGRTFPFGSYPALEAVLRGQREITDLIQQATGQIIPWVFHRRGKPIKDFRKTWKKACTAAGVPGKIPHDFRRTAVRNLERAGVPRSVAMQLTGHKTETVYRRYAIVSNKDLSEGVAKLALLHGDQNGTRERKIVEGNFGTGKVSSNAGL